MRNLIFDSSALISFGITGTLDILEFLKNNYSGKFLAPSSTRKEIVDDAIRTKKYRFQGYKLKNLFDTGVLEVVDERNSRTDMQRLGNLANQTFFAYGNAVKIIHPGEISVLALAHQSEEDDAIVIDERTTRLLVEQPENIANIMSYKLHTNISINKDQLERLKKEMTSVSILRSTDLCLAAYLKGKFGKNKDMFEGLLWGMKFAGCAISSREIREYLQFLR